MRSEKEGNQMKKRVAGLLLALMMALSLVTPAVAVETENGVSAAAASPVVTWGELTKDAPDLKLPVSGQADQTVTNQEAVAFLLRWAGMEESQLGTYPRDYNAMADNMGMTDGIAQYSPTDPCTQANLAVMKQSAQVLYQALHGQTLEPLFLNGMAQPIFPYTTGAVTEGYDNAKSDIIRYCVYVETNYDTDADGKRDLVKALVQIPRAAMEGDYKAATIYEARPYITGCTSGEAPYGKDGYDLDQMYSQPAARKAAGTATTAQAAAQADSSDWYYYNPHEEMYDYEDLTWYDYYLVRGFAVVECGGLGTKGSEGFETCGSDLEIDAFKCVIEWLNGERVAYTDKTSNIAIEADWSNGKVGMTGRSYAGTTQFGLATTGVEGLETIVPVAGIASWYEYTNSQGIATRSDPAYSDWLAWYCAGRYLDEADWNTIAGKYGNYLNQIRQDQLASNGDYSDHWANRDYTLDADKIQCPALIVHGLNDDNVRTKEFDLMYQAYEKAGVPAKLLLHQDGHLTPTYPSGGIQFMIGEQSYDEILNQWFSHYLYGVDNGIENMPAVTAQSNNDTKVWNTYDDWKTEDAITLTGESAKEKTASISSDYDAIGVNKDNWEEVFTGGSTASSAMYTMDVTADTVLKGSVAVNFQAATTNGAMVETPRGESRSAVDHDSAVDPAALDHDNYVGAATTGETVDTPEASLINRDGLMVSAMLVDIAPEGETFPAFNTAPTYVDKTVLSKDGAWMGGGLENLDLVELKPTDVSYKIVARGWMDLCNPGAGYDSASAQNKVKLVEGKYYDYTLYLQPNLYEVEAGHRLALVIYAYEPGKATYAQNYTITVDNASVSAEIPVEKAPSNPTGLPYTDVAADSWYYEAVKYVTDQGIMNGTTPTTFSPMTTTSRAMIVTMLWRMEGSPVVNYRMDFTDVKEDAYYAEAVRWAASEGIVDGYEDGTFGPDKTVTREQMATILYRYAQEKQYDVSGRNDLSAFADAARVSAYAKEAMQWAVDAGLISGIGDNLVPQNGANRAQVATMLMRFAENVNQ